MSTKKDGCRPQIVYSSLPRIGAKPLICVPKAARTCWEVSDTKSSMLVIISLSNVSRSSSPQKPGQNERSVLSDGRHGCKDLPGICPAMAVRTSASVSFNSFTNAGTRSRVTVSSSTAFAI